MKRLLLLVLLAFSPLAHASETQYSFDGWNGPAIDVRLFVPDDITPDTPIAFVIHGWSRDVERYYDDWRPLAEEQGFILVVPHYPVKDFRGGIEFNQGHVFDRETEKMRPRESWTFASIEAVFDDVVSRIDGRQTQYTIYGHSAGSQFVHRFLWHMPQTRAKRFLAANAGWYTLPDFEIAHPYGLKNSGVSREQLAAALAEDVVLLLGDEDIDAQGANLRNTPEAKAQGPNRYARGLTMFERAKAAAEDLGAPFNWRLVVVDDAGHVNAQMAPAAAEFVD